MNKHFFQQYATPISIIVAGALIGGGILISKVVSNSSSTSAPTSNTSGDVLTQITTLPVLKELGIKQKELSVCIENQTTKTKVDRDIELGRKSGAQGTPMLTFVFPNDNIAVTVPGAIPVTTMEEIIKAKALPAGFPTVEGVVTPFDPAVDRYISNSSEESDVIVIEYSDIDCPFCKKIHPELHKLLEQSEVPITWVYRHFPLPNLHEFAYIKAIAAECVAESKGNAAFWEYLDTLMK